MGVPSLCTFISPLNTGVPGFKFMYLHFLFASIICLHSFKVLLRSFLNLAVTLSLVSIASLLEMKFLTFCTYSCQGVLLLPLSYIISRIIAYYLF